MQPTRLQLKWESLSLAFQAHFDLFKIQHFFFLWPHLYHFFFLRTSLNIFLFYFYVFTTRKRDFSKGHLDWNVHIDPKVCPFWLKVWGMKNTFYIWLVHFIKMIFLTKCQVENMFKMDKCPSKWPWLNEIGHIEWIGFSEINHPDLTLSQMNHSHLMT
jgi:hypothetical protein